MPSKNELKLPFFCSLVFLECRCKLYGYLTNTVISTTVLLLTGARKNMANTNVIRRYDILCQCTHCIFTLGTFLSLSRSLCSCTNSVCDDLYGSVLCSIAERLKRSECLEVSNNSMNERLEYLPWIYIHMSRSYVALRATKSKAARVLFTSPCVPYDICATVAVCTFCSFNCRSAVVCLHILSEPHHIRLVTLSHAFILMWMSLLSSMKLVTIHWPIAFQFIGRCIELYYSICLLCALRPMIVALKLIVTVLVTIFLHLYQYLLHLMIIDEMCSIY